MKLIIIKKLSSIQHFIKNGILNDIGLNCSFRLKWFSNTSSAYGMYVYKNGTKFIDIKFDRTVRMSGYQPIKFEVNEFALYFKNGNEIIIRIDASKSKVIRNIVNDEFWYNFEIDGNIVGKVKGSSKSIFFENRAEIEMFSLNYLDHILCLTSIFVNHDLIPDSNAG